jgi:Trk K+ transport system NAD-binding subunit
VSIVAIVEEEDAVDILRLSGATSVLALKQQLDAYLAGRIETGRPEAHVVGEFRRLQIAELPARDTPFVGKIVRDTKLRQQAGVSIVGFWERGRLRPAFPETLIQHDTVLVVAGTASQIGVLNTLLPDGGDTSHPVLVIGAGKVGQAAVATLKRKGLKVHVIDRTDGALAPIAAAVDGVFAGDAVDGDLLRGAPGSCTPVPSCSRRTTMR